MTLMSRVSHYQNIHVQAIVLTFMFESIPLPDHPCPSHNNIRIASASKYQKHCAQWGKVYVLSGSLHHATAMFFFLHILTSKTCNNLIYLISTYKFRTSMIAGYCNRETQACTISCETQCCNVYPEARSPHKTLPERRASRFRVRRRFGGLYRD